MTADKVGRGSPRPIERASAVLAATRAPKSEMEVPNWRALATERLAERGARMRKRRPIPDGFAGRWRRANWVPSPILSAGACGGCAEQTDAWRVEDQREG